MNESLPVIIQCQQELMPKIRYVFDTLFMTQDLVPIYRDHPPVNGPWIFYGIVNNPALPLDRCLAIKHSPENWAFFDQRLEAGPPSVVEGIPTVLPDNDEKTNATFAINFDLIANSFYFLSSWPERHKTDHTNSRNLFADSVFKQYEIPQDIVDQYLAKLLNELNRLYNSLNLQPLEAFTWPQNKTFALVLSHDVDFIPSGLFENLRQGIKTLLRHLVRQRDPIDAFLAAKKLIQSLLDQQDPYGCVPEIIAEEQRLGVKSSFQVAVGHRHANDVNYYIENDSVRDYLSRILKQEFELCLHGSYRSTEHLEWYKEEVKILTEHLGKPIGSRQHFLSFDYDRLFTAQEQSGIQYDMSMGFPDKTGPRAGFSYPYFPYCLSEDKPYRVLQLNLFLMDVTLRGYMGLKGEKAWQAIKNTIDILRDKRGCASVVWHPIVFGGARDPGYDELYWQLVNYTHDTGGLATDGRTINDFWRNLAKNYISFH